MTDASPPYDLEGKSVFVAGHRGMVGSAVVRRLGRERCRILTAGRGELDLTSQTATEAWLAEAKPDVVIVAAAKVGGIYANDAYPAEFLRDNLAIQTNLIHGAHLAGVGKLLFLGSSCIYPKHAPQPMSEDALLTGPLEPTNEWYAVAKIAGLKMCAAYRRQYGRDFIACMPTNLYGPGDNYHPQNSHVAPALIARTHAAKADGAREMGLWGSGQALREFMHVDDLADACVFLLRNYSGEVALNVGTGQEVSILELAQTIGRVVGWSGEYVLDRSKPDGTPRKLLDVSRLTALGWTARIGLEEGLADAYRTYLAGLGGAAPEGPSAGRA